ncbi:hypothetical protein BD626DRAFT_35583 [Schizophyllum amplum]|uniref:Uncharacterized protein n=1 Tax=Schizophyllum amplum TaxID=97359 RepID=A0A550CEL1_9AGAR|nr:hypothetical protein BD626DRAFT_35583 [Auriculariopsis ampla]
MLSLALIDLSAQLPGFILMLLQTSVSLSARSTGDAIRAVRSMFCLDQPSRGMFNSLKGLHPGSLASRQRIAWVFGNFKLQAPCRVRTQMHLSGP